MSQFGPLDLRPEQGDDEGPSYEPREERSFGFVLLVGVLTIAAGIGGYLFYRSRQAPPAPTPLAAAPRATQPAIPAPEAAGLPSLDQSDDFVRELAKGLSSHALLGVWLGRQDLVRLFVNVVETVSKGESPRASLGFLAPRGPFKTKQGRGLAVIDAASYARYDSFAEGVASLDAAAGGAALKRLLPLLEAAYKELGYPEGGFEKAFREGIAHLLAVPTVEGDVRVKPVRRGNVLVYEYVDPALEALSPAQKHLLRMGPANVQRVQGALRGFASTPGS